MPAGRPPKPLELKRRLGNPGKRPLPKQSQTVALEPARGTPPVPLDLSDHARGIWQMIWESPAQAWLSPQLDAPMRVKTVCQLLGDIHDLREQIRALGWLLSEPITTPLGVVVGESIKPNPAVKMLRDAETRLDKELTALGFDPTSRSKLGLAEIKKRSILESFNRQSEPDYIEAEVIDIAPDA